MSAKHDLGMFTALWHRDLLRLRKERSRWIGVVIQPLIFWFVIGTGMTRGFQFADGTESYLRYFFPGTVVMSILFTTIFSVITVIEDRQAGFLQAVLVAPGARLALILGKVAGVTTIVLLQVAFFILVAPAAGFPWNSMHLGELALVVVSGSVALSALNFAMAWVLNSSQAYHAVMSIILIPLWIVSGAMFPLRGAWFDKLMLLNPMTYLTGGMRAAMTGADNDHGMASIVALVVFSIIFLAFSTVMLRKTRGEAQ